MANSRKEFDQKSKKYRRVYMESYGALVGDKNANPIPTPYKGNKTATRPKKVPSRRNYEKEWREQVAFVDWCLLHPAFRDDFIRIGNDGCRTKAQGYIAKRMGLRPGASDLFLSRPSGGYHGLFIEMKEARYYPPSKVREEHWIRQKDFLETRRERGYAALFAFGCDHAIKIAEAYLNGDPLPYIPVELCANLNVQCSSWNM